MQTHIAEEPSSAAPSIATSAATAYVPSYDVYGAVHKGLRWALANLLVRLGRCSASDPECLQVALDDLDGVLYLFAFHAAHEDHHVHIALEARRAGCSAVFAAAHERQERMIAELRALAHEVASASGERAAPLLRALNLRFAAFAGDNLAHMTEEEEESQRLLDTLYSREELERIHADMRTRIGPEAMRAFMRVMAIGASRDERAQMLQRARLGMPPDVFAALLASVRAELTEADTRDLAARLSL